MHKLRIILFSFFIFFLFVQVAFAQENVENNLALFATLQKELAGDPVNWQTRDVPDPTVNPNRLFIPSSTNPQQIINIEERARTTNDPINKEEFNTTSWAPGELLRKWWTFNPRSTSVGKFIRDMGGNNYFDDSYILTTGSQEEISKIRDLYTQIVGRITQYQPPQQSQNSLNACLREGRGVCRHMAIILHESLKKAGVNSQLMISPSHFWVRVTLSDEAYKGFTFDLDPTWYQQPVPLPPRERSPLSPKWKEMMLAVIATPSGRLNLNGMWGTQKGGVTEISHTENSLVQIVRKASDLYWIGKISFIGTLSGYNIKGGKLYRAEKCPSLDSLSPATGVVSSDGNTISFDSIVQYYYAESCTYTGETKPDTSTFTRIQLSPSPSPSR